MYVNKGTGGQFFIITHNPNEYSDSNEARGEPHIFPYIASFLITQ